MHILVLGGNGFIGSHFIDQAAGAGHRLSVLSRRSDPAWRHGRDFTHLEGEFEDIVAHPEWLNDVDAVCHAGWSTIPLTAASDPIRDVETNLIGTLKVLETIILAPSVRHLMFLSSGGAVYGSVDTDAPISEDHPLNPISAYGIGKMAAERYCKILLEPHNRTVMILRPANPFGPGQHGTGVLGVASTFLNNARLGIETTIFGDGSLVRDFIDVRDLARLMVKMFDAPEAGTYNCGSGRGVSLLELGKAVEDCTGLPLRLRHVAERIFDPKRVVLNISRAQTTFDWKPEISLYEGVDHLNRWLGAPPKPNRNS